MPDPYKAWLLFAPIWIDNPALSAPMVTPRPRITAPLLWLAEALLIYFLIPLTSVVFPDSEPAFPLYITDPRWPGEE